VLRRDGSSVLDSIRESGTFDDGHQDAVVKVLDEFKQSFETSEGKLLAGHEESKALDEEEVEQEQIVRQKRG
jgi:F-type H+-transporting ATPase subunit alpha